MSSVVRNILVVLICVPLVGFVAYSLYTYTQEESSKQELYDSIADEARPYEVELRELENELASMEEDAAYVSDRAKIMMGFAISAESDISDIEELSEEYGFSPIVILDCSKEYDDLVPLIDAAAETGWEIMLTAETYSDDVNEMVLSVLSYLDEVEAGQTGVFLLRNSSYSSAAVEMLADDGFIGYTVYNSTVPEDGQDDDGNVYFEYYYMSSDSSAISNKLAYMYSNRTSMIIAIDMAAVESGGISEKFLTNLMEATQEYDEYDECTYATVAEVVEELSEINEIEADNKEANQETVDQMQERIDELNDIIDEIWSRYSGSED
ncbi:MAG: hypothetical protein LIO37_00190 [Clostridiales bacterium]|nr:hypothetical protein [Clostridiales bacterium]